MKTSEIKIYLNNLFVLSMIIISICLLPITILILEYYPNLLSISALSSLLNSRKGMPLSFLTETIIIEFIIVILKVLYKRLHKNFQIITLLSTLLIITVSINQNILSPIVILMSSFTVITSFLVENSIDYPLNINLYRWFLIALIALLGILGLNIGLILIICTIYSKENLHNELNINPKPLINLIPSMKKEYKDEKN